MRGRKAVHNAATIRQTVGYVRVSTEEQAKTGVSLAAQEERIKAFAVGRGRAVDDIIIDDGASGSSLKRDGLQRILSGIQAGQIGEIVVLKLDRLTRSVRDLLDLIELFDKRDVALVSINETLDTSSAMGRCIIKVIGSISELEREQIGERTAFALSHLRRSGKVYGQVPYGWTRQGKQLVPEPEQQRALSLARRLAADGLSLRQIGDKLTKSGHKPQRGSVWHAATVRSILNSKAVVEAA